MVPRPRGAMSSLHVSGWRPTKETFFNPWRWQWDPLVVLTSFFTVTLTGHDQGHGWKMFLLPGIMGLPSYQFLRQMHCIAPIQDIQNIGYYNVKGTLHLGRSFINSSGRHSKQYSIQTIYCTSMIQAMQPYFGEATGRDYVPIVHTLLPRALWHIYPKLFGLLRLVNYDSPHKGCFQTSIFLH